jgi:hypothetical protein
MGVAPFEALAKMPSQRISAKERLRRLEEAKRFLRQQLATGPRPAKALIKDAKAAGIVSRTLHRAKDALDVQVQRHGWGQGGQWIWVPPLWQAQSDGLIRSTADKAEHVLSPRL